MVLGLVYKCTKCDRITDRGDLTVKKVTWVTMGEGGKALKSRVLGRTCPGCTIEDDDWNLPKFAKGHHG